MLEHTYGDVPLSVTCMFHRLFQLGLTCVHSAARHGRSDVLAQLRAMNISLEITSKKTGLSPLHVAAFDGNIGALITYQRSSIFLFEQL